MKRFKIGELLSSIAIVLLLLKAMGVVDISTGAILAPIFILGIHAVISTIRVFMAYKAITEFAYVISGIMHWLKGE